jgi:hypothetical protein
MRTASKEIKEQKYFCYTCCEFLEADAFYITKNRHCKNCKPRNLPLREKQHPPMLPEKDRYLLRLNKFNPKTLNDKSWQYNAIITEIPTAVITKNKGEHPFKIQFKTKEFHCKSIDHVYRVLNALIINYKLV